jgi:hypothetical protein
VSDSESFDGLDFFEPVGTWSNATGEPPTAESLAAAIRELGRVWGKPPRPEPILVSPRVWSRMEAVKREFPKATDMQCLGAACFAVDDADAIRRFAIWNVSPRAAHREPVAR